MLADGEQKLKHNLTTTVDPQSLTWVRVSCPMPSERISSVSEALRSGTAK